DNNLPYDPEGPPAPDDRLPWPSVVVRHVVLGVPVAALLHTVVRCAYDYSPASPGPLWWPVAHFLLGMVCGSFVLVPAFCLQAAVALGVRRAGGDGPPQAAAGAA